MRRLTLMSEESSVVELRELMQEQIQSSRIVTEKGNQLVIFIPFDAINDMQEFFKLGR